MSDTPESVARRSADAMWAGDAASQGLGMELVAVAPGRATLRMRVRADMVNGHAIGHGGFTFTLADSAFAFACNSYNRSTVAAACEVRFLAPTRLGDVLEATAVERSRAGRDGVYDVTVPLRRDRGGGVHRPQQGDPRHALRGGRMTGEVPGYDVETLRALQLDRLRDTLARAYAHVPHYRRAFDDAGVRPEDLHTLADLARFPFTAKEDLRQNYPFGMFAVPREQVSRVHASSAVRRAGRRSWATPPRTSPRGRS